MARLVDIRDVPSLPSTLVVRVGDLIVLGATGAHVPPDFAGLELVGAFAPAVLGNDGQVISPASAPNSVVLLAHGTGQGAIDVVTGDPWRGARKSALAIVIEP